MTQQIDWSKANGNVDVDSTTPNGIVFASEVRIINLSAIQHLTIICLHLHVLTPKTANIKAYVQQSLVGRIPSRVIGISGVSTINGSFMPHMPPQLIGYTTDAWHKLVIQDLKDNGIG